MVTEMLHESYPLLLALSPEQLDAIDIGVLWMPSEAEREIIHALSKLLNKHVVIYRGDYEPRKGHLCRLIKPAALQYDQLKEVQAVEKSLASKNKIVVVYEKPVIFRSAL